MGGDQAYNREQASYGNMSRQRELFPKKIHQDTSESRQMGSRKSNLSISSLRKSMDLKLHKNANPQTPQTSSISPSRVANPTGLKNGTPLKKIETRLAVATPQATQAMRQFDCSEDNARSGSMRVDSTTQPQYPLKRTASPANSDVEAGDRPLRKKHKLENSEADQNTLIGYHKIVGSLKVAAKVNDDGDLEAHVLITESTPLKAITAWESLVEDTKNTRIDLKDVVLDKDIFRLYVESVDLMTNELKCRLIKQYLTSRSAVPSLEHGNLKVEPVTPTEKEHHNLEPSNCHLSMASPPVEIHRMAVTPSSITKRSNLETPELPVGHLKVNKNICVLAYFRKDANPASRPVLFKKDKADVKDSDLEFSRLGINRECLQKDVVFYPEFAQGDMEEIMTVIKTRLSSKISRQTQQAENAIHEELQSLPAVQTTSPDFFSVSDIDMSNSETIIVAHPTHEMLPSVETNAFADAMTKLDGVKEALKTAADYEKKVLFREEQVAKNAIIVKQQNALSLEREEKLMSKEKKLAEHEASVLAREKEIETQKAWIDEQTKLPSARKREIGPREDAVKEREADARKKFEERLDQQIKIRERENAIKVREQLVEKKEAANSKDKKELARTQDLVSKKEQEFARMEKAILKEQGKARKAIEKVARLKEDAAKIKQASSARTLNLYNSTFEEAFAIVSPEKAPWTFIEQLPRPVGNIFPHDPKLGGKTFLESRVLQAPISVEGTLAEELIHCNGRSYLVYEEDGLMKLLGQRPEPLIHTDGKIYVCWYLYKEVSLKF